MNIMDMFCKDVCDVFLNLDEFAEVHSLNGRRVKCVIDRNITADISPELVLAWSEGVAVGGIRVYVKQGAVPRPRQGDLFRVDESLHTVQSTSLEQGMLVIELDENEAGR